MESTSGLNQEQKRVVSHRSGPLLVVAGPGTGKTTVLTHYLANLIKSGRARPEEILALTFTQKAAQEMAERVGDLFPEEYLDLPVYTFHGFAQQVLNQYGLDIGLPSPFRIASGQDLRIILKKNWGRFSFDYYRPQGDNGPLIFNLIKHFSRCKDDGVGPDEYLQSYGQKAKDAQERVRRGELAEAYRAYQQILLNEGVLDFGDLLYYLEKLFQSRPHLGRLYQEKIKYVLIDEFQDTNKIQYQIARFLSEKNQNLVVCASADQTIYQWRGAYYGNVEFFKKDYPRSKKIVLKKNYRSSQNLLDLSYLFIARNNSLGRKEKKDGLKAVDRRKGRVRVWSFPDKDSEAREVANEIVKLIDRKTSLSEIAVLTRTNESVHIFEESLRRSGVPVRAFSAGEMYRQPIVLDILAYLTLRSDPEDNASFYRYLNFPNWLLNEEERGLIMGLARRQGRSIFQTISRQEVFKRLPLNKRKVLNQMKEWLKGSVDRIDRQVFDFLERSGYLKLWLKGNPSQFEAESLNLFLERLNSFQRDHPDLNIDSFLEQIEWERSAGGETSFTNLEQAVSVMTVHSAKGLEFEHVFLVNLVDPGFPARSQSESIPWLDQTESHSHHLAEERRLFFVAMTRAKRSLYFTWSKGGEGKREKKPSRFLVELGLIGQARELGAVQKKSLKQGFRGRVKLPDYFSYTQLVNFRSCPWQYKLNHILRIEARGGARRSLGQTLHRTLADYLKEWHSSRGKVSWSELKKTYQRNWIDDWYENDQQRAEFKAEGLNSLRSFYQEIKKNPPQVYSARGRLWLEVDFSGLLAGYHFRGKIDRVDKTEDGLELIDYKIGSAPEKIGSREKEQLLVYYLAAARMLKIQPNLLSLYYLGSCQKLSFRVQEKDLIRVESKIRETILKIKKSDFQAKPGFHCRYCDFRVVCSFRR